LTLSWSAQAQLLQDSSEYGQGASSQDALGLQDGLASLGGVAKPQAKPHAKPHAEPPVLQDSSKYGDSEEMAFEKASFEKAPTHEPDAQNVPDESAEDDDDDEEEEEEEEKESKS
jgi:hypothetical protein